MAGPIVACILSRDEPGLLRENVMHLIHREKINHIVVTNHVTIDENKEVLKEFGDAIVEQFDYARPYPFPQNEWRTKMARLAITRCNASWIACTDTDEFWYNLHQLHELPPNVRSVTIKRLYDHYGTQLDPAKGYSVYNMPWHKMGRNTVGKTLHRVAGPKMTIRHCSHRPVQRGRVLLDPLNIHMHHYPVRDWDRFLLKVHTANPNNTPGHRRTTWRNLEKEGYLRAHWENEHMTPVEILQARVAAGEAGYFVPEECGKLAT